MRHVQCPVSCFDPHSNAVPGAYFYSHNKEQYEGNHEANKKDSEQGNFLQEKYVSIGLGMVKSFDK